jgi:hypothetical protein
MLALGAVVGVLWFWLAAPVVWEVTSRGIGVSESASRAQFGVIVTFVTLGAVLCLVWGWAAGHVLRDIGWLLVPIFTVMTGLAALIAWRVGYTLGPPDPSKIRTMAGLFVGERLPAPPDIDAVAPFLVWPMFALLGLLLSAWLDRSDDDHADDLASDHA